jgi:hypothetical protein
MGGLAHLSDFMFEVPCRSDLNDRDPLVRAGVFARGSIYGTVKAARWALCSRRLPAAGTFGLGQDRGRPAR